MAELTPVALRGLHERFRAEHVGLLLTLVYLFLAGVGMGPRWLRGSEASRAFVARHVSTLFLAAVALYALAFSLTYASMTARRLRQGQGQHVHVELVADPAHSAADTTSMLLLGTTQKFVFLYDPARRATSVIPASNIARLVVTRGPRATAR